MQTDPDAIRADAPRVAQPAGREAEQNEPDGALAPSRSPRWTTDRPKHYLTTTTRA